MSDDLADALFAFGFLLFLAAIAWLFIFGFYSAYGEWGHIGAVGYLFGMAVVSVLLGALSLGDDAGWPA